MSGSELSRPKGMAEMTEKPVFVIFVVPIHVDMDGQLKVKSSIRNMMDLGHVDRLGPPLQGIVSSESRMLKLESGEQEAESCLEAIGSELGEAYPHMVEVALL